MKKQQNKKKNNFNRSDNYSSKRSNAKAGAFNKEMDKAQDTIKHLGEVENDASFYFNKEEYIKPFANIPFNNIVGLQTSGWPTMSDQIDSVVMSGLPTKHQVPGVLTIDFLPTVGYADSPTSPLNVASTKNYAFIRHENSGSTNYDATNLMMYNMAVLSLIPACLHIRRALLSIGLYSEVNRYAPDTIIKAMGFSPYSIRSDLANLIGRYNLMTARFNKFAIPAGFKHVLRWKFLCDNIFTDRNMAKAQLYIFRPMTYMTYEETGTDSGLPELKTQKFLNTGSLTPTMKIVDAIDKIEKALDKLYMSDAIGTMSGDVLKAYGLENLYKLDPITATDTVKPVYSETALWQIHNCTTVPYVSFQTANSLPKQDDTINALCGTRMQEIVDETNATSYLAQIYSFTGPSGTADEMKFGTMAATYLGAASVMDVDRDSPNYQDVLEITRTKSLCTKRLNSSVCVDAIGTEIYLQFTLWDLSNGGNAPASRFGTYWNRYNSTSDEVSQMDAATNRLTAFDWAPIIVGVDKINNNVQADRLISELDNSVFINAGDLAALNSAVMQYVFGVLD